MTMLLGYNFGDRAYLTADTRVTDSLTNEKEDIQQKIEILQSQNLIIAVAGRVFLASQIISLIKNNNLTFPTSATSFKKNIKPIIRSYLMENWKRIISKPSDLDAILLIESVSKEKITFESFHITFFGLDIDKVKVKNLIVKDGEFVKIGAIYESEPVKKASVPVDISTRMKSDIEKDELEDYFSVTNEMFSLAKALDSQEVIGGKTTTVMTYKNKDKFLFRGVKGLRSITHSDGEFQDVSSYTDLDINSGGFYIRDIRNDGKIISNIEKEGKKYIFHYDSCPLNSGKEDFIYKRLIDLSETESRILVFSV